MNEEVWKDPPASQPRRVTMRDVARLAKMPVSSVALALHDKPGVSAARRRAVIAAAESLGYLAPRPGRPKIIGLVIEDLSREAKLDGFIDSIIQGVYSAARDREVHVALALYRDGTNPYDELRALTRGPVDGVILTNGGDITAQVVKEVAGTGVPTVLVENYVSVPVSSVVADNFTAGLVSTQHLIDLGHERIAVVSGSDRYVSLTDRLRGFYTAMREANLTVPSLYAPPQGSSSNTKGFDQTMALLDLASPPTAIYAVSDKSARGVYQAAAARDVIVGRDLSVVATDNVEESTYRSPPLTTFDVFARRLGVEALETLIEARPADLSPRRVVVPGQLIVRSSTSRLSTE